MITCYPVRTPGGQGGRAPHAQLWISGEALLEDLTMRGALQRLRGESTRSDAPATLRLIPRAEVWAHETTLLGALRGPLLPSLGGSRTTETCVSADIPRTIGTHELNASSSHVGEGYGLPLTERLWSSPRSVGTPGYDSVRQNVTPAHQKESLITALQHLAELGPDAGAPSMNARDLKRSLTLARQCAGASTRLNESWPAVVTPAMDTAGLLATRLLCNLSALRTLGPLPHVPHDLPPALLCAALRGAAYLDELGRMGADSPVTALGAGGLRLRSNWAAHVQGLYLERWASSWAPGESILVTLQRLSLATSGGLSLNTDIWGTQWPEHTDETLTRAAGARTLDELSHLLGFEGPDEPSWPGWNPTPLTAPITPTVTDNLASTARTFKLPHGSEALAQLTRDRLDMAWLQFTPPLSARAITGWHHLCGAPLNLQGDETEADQPQMPVWISLRHADTGLWVDAGPWISSLLAQRSLQQLRGLPTVATDIPEVGILNPATFSARTWSRISAARSGPALQTGPLQMVTGSTLNTTGPHLTCPGLLSGDMASVMTRACQVQLQLLIKAARLQSVQLGLHGADPQARTWADDYAALAGDLGLLGRARGHSVREGLFGTHLDQDAPPQLRADHDRLMEALGIRSLNLGGVAP